MTAPLRRCPDCQLGYVVAGVCNRAICGASVPPVALELVRRPLAGRHAYTVHPCRRCGADMEAHGNRRYCPTCKPRVLRENDRRRRPPPKGYQQRACKGCGRASLMWHNKTWCEGCRAEVNRVRCRARMRLVRLARSLGLDKLLEQAG